MVNKDLQHNYEQGVVFYLDVKSDLQCFYLLDLVKIKRELPPLNRVEEFKVENRLKPVGLILTVHKDSVYIYNFDEGLDKFKNTCAQIASLDLPY